MSENKFTPGPWIRDKYGNVKTECGESVGFRGVTITCSGNDDRVEAAEANTDLIAAAPDLLEALSEIINDGGKFVMTNETHRKARAAIARARGEA